MARQWRRAAAKRVATCEAKVAYTTEAQARGSASFLRLSRPVKAYHCWCGRWHLTSAR